MARKVERFSRDVPVGREVLVSTMTEVNYGVADRGHELLVPARALLYADWHLLCVHFRCGALRSFMAHQRPRLKERLRCQCLLQHLVAKRANAHGWFAPFVWP